MRDHADLLVWEELRVLASQRLCELKQELRALEVDTLDFLGLRHEDEPILELQQSNDL